MIINTEQHGESDSDKTTYQADHKKGKNRDAVSSFAGVLSLDNWS
jgi:hypothetical protein